MSARTYADGNTVVTVSEAEAVAIASTLQSAADDTFELWTEDRVYPDAVTRRLDAYEAFTCRPHPRKDRYLAALADRRAVDA